MFVRSRRIYLTCNSHLSFFLCSRAAKKVKDESGANLKKIHTKGKFEEFHDYVAKTRDERMLKTHEVYKKAW